MPRMKKESAMVAKAVDCFLQVFPRIFSSHSSGFREWLFLVNEFLSEEVDERYLSAVQEIYFRNYVLCVVQVFLIADLREFHASEVSSDAYIKIGGKVFYLKGFLSGEDDPVEFVNSSTVIAVLASSYNRISMGVGFDEIVKSAKKIIYKIDHSGFPISDVELKYVVDLPVNSYVAENPLCIMEMLMYFHHVGVFNSSKMSSSLKRGTFESVLSLALSREFNAAVFFGSHILLDRKSRSKKNKNIGLGLPGKEEAEYERESFEIKFDGEKLRLKHYRDMAKNIIDSKREVQVLPVIGLDIPDSSLFEILGYAVKNHSPKVVCSEKGKLLRSDGIISLVCSFYLKAELGMIAEGKKGLFDKLEKKTGKVNAAELVSLEINNLFSVSVSGSSIYRSFREYGDGFFDSARGRWEDVFKNRPELINLCEWADLQIILGSFEY